MTSDRRWAAAVRWLSAALLLVLVVAVLEAIAIRKARSELQQLRAERDAAKGRLAETWARQSSEEFQDAVRSLHDFLGDSIDGAGRAGGLCPGGAPDGKSIATLVLGVYLPARAAGRSPQGAIEVMRTAALKSSRQ
jgi:hypothetical protein